MRRSWIGMIALTLVLQVPDVQAQQAVVTADGSPTVNAVWVEHELSFTFMGVTSHYSCDGLRDKVRRILQDLGARPGFKVTSRGCIHLTGPDRMPGVRIVAALPREATPEVVGQLASDASRKQLAARATGGPAAEATAQFAARARRVDFRSGPTGYVQDGDCELMEQLRDDLFPRLGVRVVEHDIDCVPHQINPGAVRMTVEVLEPVPAQ